MAPDTPVRASSPHRVRGAARTPSPSLTVRHGIGFAMNPCASLLRLYAEAGPVAAIGTRRKPFVHLFGPDANAFVFANSALFQWREAFDLLVPVNGETALIVSDGADHRRRRRLVQPAFHHRRVAGYVARMAANTDAALDSWRPGQTLDAYAELRAVIRRNTVEVLFGDRLAADAEVIGRRLQVALAAIDQNFVLQMMLRSVPNPYMRRVAASRDLVVRRVDEEVQRREAEGGEHDDVLGMLLAARDEDGTGLTRQELQDQVISLISAGYDTTSAAMAWAVYALLAHPDAAERARREVAEVVGDRPVEAADLPALTYLDGVVNETLRLFPPAVLSARVPVEDFEYAGHRIPAGAMVFYSPFVTHRMPEVWPQAGRFRPERWDPSSDLHRPTTPATFLPFGGGPHRCIGSTLATTELKTMLACLLRRTRLRLVSPAVTPTSVTAMRPRGGLPVRVL
ncbi:cytochrome P450 [Actinomadura madurae]|uniref:cytochrome P450 n=1 Tax=Actinomadura madurae TaxID=1993 RepID=UPI000D97F86B|nr:cytochrome P450 [Actinomadura madurae]SPT64222.1 Putative cytochrome P450 120 [Actinomadura madurae]